MNKCRDNSQKLDKSSLSVRQIISRNVYPIEILLGLYRPLNVPRNIFKLETVVQRPNVHSLNNFSYARSTGPSGQSFNHLHKKQKNCYFNTHNKTVFGAIEANSSPRRDQKIHEGRVVSGVSDKHSWRKNKPVIVENGVVQEPVSSGQFTPRRNVERTEAKRRGGGGAGFGSRNRITDLEEDMSSIEKILNKKFERKSIDSEKFIRKKLVMALEGVGSRASQNKVGGEALSGFDIGGERSGQLHPERFVETGRDLSIESANNIIPVNLSDHSPNGLYHGDYNSVDSRLFRTNIVSGNVLNNRLANIFRAIPNTYGNCGVGSFDGGKEVKKDHPSLGANLQSSYINSRIGGCQPTQNHHNIGLEIRQEIDVLDNPIWLYKELGSFAVNGPFSTRQMSSLWKSYTFTHKTLFTLTSKYVWGPINLFYPEVKSTFTYIPDLEVISQRLTDISFQTDQIEKIKSEDISSIISKINELQLNADNRISPPKLVSSAISIEKSSSEKTSSDSLGSEDNQVQVQDLAVEPDDDHQAESQEDEESSGPESATQHSPTEGVEAGTAATAAAPRGGGWATSDGLKEKKEVVSFQSILKEEEEISSREKLKKEAMSRASEVNNSEPRVSDAPKGWKVIPKEKPGAFMEPFLNDKGLSDQETTRQVVVPPQVTYSVNLGVNNWKGWGNKTGPSERQAGTVDLFEDVTLGSLSNFSASQTQKNSNNQGGFWEMCNSDSKQQSSAWNNGSGDIALKAGSAPDADIIDRRAENDADKVDGAGASGIGLGEKKPTSNPVKPAGQKNKRKKGKKVDSSLLAFGIRSDKPRNLNYDLD